MADRLPDGLGSAGMKGRAVYSFSFFRVGWMRLGLDAGILAKMRCGIFEKARTVRSSRVPKNFLGKFRENFLGKLFWEKFGGVDDRWS